MLSYSETDVFDRTELDLLRRVTRLAASVVEEELLVGVGGMAQPAGRSERVRCHELARAVARVTGLTVQDGRYGFVEHTWLWTQRLERPLAFKWSLPNILDVYAVGSLPQVQLIHMVPGTGHVQVYQPAATERDDIDEAMVDRLVAAMRAADERAER